MPRHDNKPRPERVTHQPQIVEEALPIAQSSCHISYLTKHIKAAPKKCCKDPDNLTYHTEKTDPGLPYANKAVITCKSCGCRHSRIVGSPGANQL